MKNKDLGLIFIFDKTDVVDTNYILKNKGISGKIALNESRTKCNPNLVKLTLTLI